MPKTVLFIKPSNSTFILKDETFLQEEYRLFSHHYVYGNALRHLSSTIHLLFWLLRRLAAADVVIVWFADYHSWLPVGLARILGKPSIVMVAGYDVARLPEFNYGVFVRRFRGWCARIALRNADHLCPVAASLVEDIRTHIGAVKGRIQVIPFGFSAQKWYPAGEKENNLILTVSVGEDLRRMRIKGLDLFAAAAQRLPEGHFMIIGPQGEMLNHLRELQIPNLQLLPPLPPAELLSHFQRAAVYAQFSIREGLPNAILEGMLCECIPVGVPAGGIPEAIGDAGFMAASRSVETVVEALHQALAADRQLGRKARERTMILFSEERRRSALREIIAGAAPHAN
ncbi:MAG TPA: glycosyltransferase family 4 protein [bacterium]|nr:glycosyltransferase family 4 protein [bacterium]